MNNAFESLVEIRALVASLQRSWRGRENYDGSSSGGGGGGDDNGGEVEAAVAARVAAADRRVSALVQRQLAVRFTR
eukprot:COSAG06_NODE_594_length_13939_cov_45.080202_13_plen_76_part_00